MYAAKISNEEVNELPAGGFSGRVVVVDTPETMREAEEALRTQRFIGYDTETRPSFSRGVVHKMALVQLSTADTAFLIRVQRVDFSPGMLRILESPAILKIGAALRDDLRSMRKVAPFTPAGFVDLQSIVGRWGVEELSVRKMAAVVLGFKISKAQRLSNWEAVELTPAQCEYAATDAWVCREIYCKLTQQP